MTTARVRLAACLGLVMTLLLALSGTARALPGAELAPIRGMAYQPAPSDYKGDGAGVYFDSDFFNDDFKQLWSTADGGRGDLHAMRTQLNVNFLHLYNWNPARNHLAFLNEALANGIHVAVPISNFFVWQSTTPEADIEKIVRQVYVDSAGNPTPVPHPAVTMWTIGNEYDLTPQTTATKIAEATAYLVAAEKKIGATTLLPVSVPVSFSTFGDPERPGVVKTLEAIAALKANPALGDAFVASRFVAATNPQNEGSFIEQWLPKFKAAVPDTMLWFSELGTAVIHSCDGYPQPCTPSEEQQALFNAGEWQASQPGAAGILLGGAQFEWVNEDWKGGADATFGIYKYSGTYREVVGTGGKYRVDDLVRKPSWSALQTAFGGSGSVGLGSSPGGFLGALGPAAAAVAAVGGSGLCDPSLSGCALAADEPAAPVAPDSGGAEDDDSAVGGAPRMPNLRATASARWVDGSVRVRVKVVATRAQLVRRGFLVRVSIPSLGERKDVMVRLHGDRVRTKVIRVETPASAIGRRVVVEVDPTRRVLEARERDNGARTRVT